MVEGYEGGVCNRKMNIKTVYEEGFNWVEIPDELWAKAQIFTYFNGMDVT